MPQAATWSPNMLTNVPAMDELHRDFFKSLNDLSSVSDEEFCMHYGLFVQKAEHAFLTEERWMEEIDYPMLKSHREQHARVLSALHHVHRRIQEDDLAIGRDIVDRLLPQWFMFHVSTMDKALASELQATGKKLAYALPDDSDWQ